MTHGALDIVKVVINQGKVLFQIVQMRQMYMSFIQDLLVFTLVGNLTHAHYTTRLCHLVFKSFDLPCQLGEWLFNCDGIEELQILGIVFLLLKVMLHLYLACHWDVTGSMVYLHDLLLCLHKLTLLILKKNGLKLATRRMVIHHFRILEAVHLVCVDLNLSKLLSCQCSLPFELSSLVFEELLHLLRVGPMRTPLNHMPILPTLTIALLRIIGLLPLLVHNL